MESLIGDRRSRRDRTPPAQFEFDPTMEELPTINPTDLGILPPAEAAHTSEPPREVIEMESTDEEGYEDSTQEVGDDNLGSAGHDVPLTDEESEDESGSDEEFLTDKGENLAPVACVPALQPPDAWTGDESPTTYAMPTGVDVTAVNQASGIVPITEGSVRSNWPAFGQHQDPTGPAQTTWEAQRVFSPYEIPIIADPSSMQPLGFGSVANATSHNWQTLAPSHTYGVHPNKYWRGTRGILGPSPQTNAGTVEPSQGGNESESSAQIDWGAFSGYRSATDFVEIGSTSAPGDNASNYALSQEGGSEIMPPPLQKRPSAGNESLWSTNTKRSRTDDSFKSFKLSGTLTVTTQSVHGANNVENLDFSDHTLNPSIGRQLASAYHASKLAEYKDD